MAWHPLQQLREFSGDFGKEPERLRGGSMHDFRELVDSRRSQL